MRSWSRWAAFPSTYLFRPLMLVVFESVVSCSLREISPLRATAEAMMDSRNLRYIDTSGHLLCIVQLTPPNVHAPALRGPLSFNQYSLGSCPSVITPSTLPLPLMGAKEISRCEPFNAHRVIASRGSFPRTSELHVSPPRHRRSRRLTVRCGECGGDSIRTTNHAALRISMCLSYFWCRCYGIRLPDRYNTCYPHSFEPSTHFQRVPRSWLRGIQQPS